jgi:hypothetical protein
MCLPFSVQKSCNNNDVINRFISCSALYLINHGMACFFSAKPKAFAVFCCSKLTALGSKEKALLLQHQSSQTLIEYKIHPYPLAIS